MGGAQAGEVASRMAVDAFGGGLPDGAGTAEERLAAPSQDANARDPRDGASRRASAPAWGRR